jgi:hypothetical protein
MNRYRYGPPETQDLEADYLLRIQANLEAARGNMGVQGGWGIF